MAKKSTRDEIVELHDQVAAESFQKEVKTTGVRQYGVCGIDLNNRGELTKVTAAIIASRKNK